MSWVWTAWLLVIGISFAGFEGYALTHNKMTLSRWTWTVSKAWSCCSRGSSGWWLGSLLVTSGGEGLFALTQ